ncbi:zinc-dependent alcohol dehydrogenase [Paenibacillus thalictri]|uniref:Galactitol-1-phosphate 5-dehydrogenase n=1 Tax=Paenibacillus thalictri TaxID=2527873 RepID=A0A4Q9DS74_9BACL|nr:zinc-binding dehydrogenase [Paenibacillus thalictri]TBL76594.1 galactitol-1-phosphate 5-dehydrogenase [Paenibacillus thalictri]
MKAIVYQGPRQLSMEEHEVPQAGPGEAIVKVEAVGICGSELEGYLGHSSVRVPPLVMGHECCGTIVDACGADGAAAANWSAGDKVVVNPLINCGSCDRCLAGKTHLCRHRVLIGIHRPGAFAEYVKVPLQSLLVVPKTLDSSLASLAEPLAVCIHALKLGLRPFGELLIFGAGAIGLLTLQAARNMGAQRILVVDRQEARLGHAAALGADTATPEQLEAKLSELAPGGIDTIIDCVGVTATRQQALQWISPGGIIVLVGLGHDESPLQLNRLIRQEVALFGSYSYTREDFTQAVRLLTGGKISMDRWTGTCRLTEAPDAFHVLAEGSSPFSKIILHP